MNLFALTILSLCWTAIVGEKAAGIVERASKMVVTNDMLYILKTIIEDVKWYSFKDIRATSNLALSNIEVTDVKFNRDAKNFKLEVSPDTKSVILSATHPDLTYTFKFNLKGEAKGMHVLFEEGFASFRATNLNAVYNPVVRTSDVSAQWVFNFINITNSRFITTETKAWIASSLRTQVMEEITKGIAQNKHFLHEYMHRRSQQLRKTLTANYTLEYNGHIFDVLEDEDKTSLVFLHNVSLSLNGHLRYILNSAIGIPPKKEQHDVSIYIAPQFIPLTISAHGNVGKCDEYYDMKSLGFSGTVKDLFEPLPELYSLYSGSEELTMYCEYAHDGVTELDNQQIIIPVSCTFAVEGATVLSSHVFLQMTYGAIELKNFFATKMSNVVALRCTSKPETLSTVVFLMKLYSQFGQQKFGGKELPIPMIVYEPLLNPSKITPRVEDGIFVAHYDY